MNRLQCSTYKIMAINYYIPRRTTIPLLRSRTITARPSQSVYAGAQRPEVIPLPIVRYWISSSSVQSAGGPVGPLYCSRVSAAQSNISATRLFIIIIHVHICARRQMMCSASKAKRSIYILFPSGTRREFAGGRSARVRDKLPELSAAAASVSRHAPEAVRTRSLSARVPTSI